MKMRFYSAVFLFCALLAWLPAKESAAHSTSRCDRTRCNPGTCEPVSKEEADKSVKEINEHVDQEFDAHNVWIISIWWEDNVLPAMMLMAEQMTAVAMKQTEIIGGFFDAKHQLETQQVFQKLRTRAHKDYHPSVGMCEFGSSVKSLAASERIGEVNAVILSQRAQDRALGNANTLGSAGIDGDAQGRLKQFRETYCDIRDNNNGLDFMCDHEQDRNPSSGEIGAADKKRVNKDIDFARTLDSPWTLNVNFTDTDLKEDEEDVLALASNLYGREVFSRVGADLLRSTKPDSDIETPDDLTPVQNAYMDARAILAKRSVAENSFNAIVGMKSAGTGGSRDYLQALLAELGIDDTANNVAGAGDAKKTQLDLLLGDNPSYYGQMEVLTKKIYQNPDFYTNLYDKPVNVERKGVALQAIGLMQKFDLFKSYLRNEASLSVLLELAVIELQEEIESEIDASEPGGELAGKPSGGGGDEEAPAP